MNRQSIHEEMERARAAFHTLTSQASSADLRRGSNGTRWTNQQLLFHMLFGYMIVRVLLGLVRAFGLTRRLDRTVAALHRHLDHETDETLSRVMQFPVGWDPFFSDGMSLLEVYHYATQHFDFHRRQLTLQQPES